MNLHNAILSALSTAELKDSDTIIRAVLAMDWPEQEPRPGEIIDALEVLAKDGRVLQSWRHRSWFRKRTSEEYAAEINVRTGRQPELL